MEFDKITEWGDIGRRMIVRCGGCAQGWLVFGLSVATRTFAKTAATASLSTAGTLVTFKEHPEMFHD